MINPDPASSAMPPAGTPRTAVPGYVPWMVRVPVVLNLGFIFLSFAMFLFAVLRLGFAHGGTLDASILRLLAMPLTTMTVTALVNFVLLFFVWRYSRIACGLLVLVTLLGLGTSIYWSIRGNGFGPHLVTLVFAMVRLLTDLVALAGTFLYHAARQRSVAAESGAAVQ